MSTGDAKGSAEGAPISSGSSKTTTVIRREPTAAPLAPSQEGVHARSALEAVLFAAEGPVERAELYALLDRFDDEVVARELRQLQLDYSGPSRGIHLVEVAGGLQFRTNPDQHDFVLGLYEARPTRLSKAALESLAIVAYRQPVTRAEVEEIRGVDCGGVLRKLGDLDLVTVVGRMDDIGRPNLYGTTARFLEFFGLSSIAELPTLEEFDIDAAELLEESGPGAEARQLIDENDV